MRPDACGICLLKQTASGAQSVTSPSKIEGLREFEADLSALFYSVRKTLESVLKIWHSGDFRIASHSDEQFQTDLTRFKDSCLDSTCIA